MNFSPIWELLPQAFGLIIWLWPVAIAAGRLAAYWFTEHQVWWGITGLFALLYYWFWSDNRHDNGN